MEAAGILVVVLVEFSAGVQPRQNKFDARNFFLRMFVDRHAPTIVLHFDRAIRVQSDFDLFAMACKRLIDAVIDHFMCQVIRSGCICIHSRSAPYWLETT